MSDAIWIALGLCIVGVFIDHGLTNIARAIILYSESQKSAAASTRGGLG
jgi:hypothetical protein